MELTAYTSLPSLWHLKVKFLDCMDSSTWCTATRPSIEPTCGQDIFTCQASEHPSKGSRSTLLAASADAGGMVIAHASKSSLALAAERSIRPCCSPGSLLRLGSR